MDPLTAALAAQGILALLEIYRMHANKPPGWVPTAEDWNELETWAHTTPEDIKRAAAQRAGVPWPPVEQ